MAKKRPIVKRDIIRKKVLSIISGFSLRIIVLLVLVNLGMLYSLRIMLVRSQACMTREQVASDSRCLYIYSNKVFEMSIRDNPHRSHPCGTDVTDIIPATHMANVTSYLDPNYIADICSGPPPTVTPTPQPPTPTPTPVPTATPTSAVSTSPPTLTPTQQPAASPTPTTTSKPTATPTLGRGGGLFTTPTPISSPTLTEILPEPTLSSIAGRASVNFRLAESMTVTGGSDVSLPIMIESIQAEVSAVSMRVTFSDTALVLTPRLDSGPRFSDWKLSTPLRMQGNLMNWALVSPEDSAKRFKGDGTLFAVISFKVPEVEETKMLTVDLISENSLISTTVAAVENNQFVEVSLEGELGEVVINPVPTSTPIPEQEPGGGISEPFKERLISLSKFFIYVNLIILVVTIIVWIFLSVRRLMKKIFAE